MASGVHAARQARGGKQLTPDAQYMSRVGLPHIIDRLLRHVLTSQPPDQRGIIESIAFACGDELQTLPESEGELKEPARIPPAGGAAAFIGGELTTAQCLDALDALPAAERREQIALLCNAAQNKGTAAPAATTGTGVGGSAAVAGSLLTGTDLYHFLVQETLKMVPAGARAVLHLRDADNEVLFNPLEPASRARVGDGVVGKVAEDQSAAGLSVTFGPAHDVTESDKAMLGGDVKRVVTAAIVHPKLHVLGTLSVVQDSSGGDGFTQQDTDALSQVARSAVLPLYASLCTEQLDASRNQVDVLLDVARRLASELEVTSLIKTIMQVSRDLLQADRATLFLVDKEKDQLYSSVADGTGEIRIPRAAGIAGAVATTGKHINIPSAYSDSRFTTGMGPKIDEKTGYSTNSILCMPMANREKEVIGVTQMINKKSGSAFGKDDTRLLEAFSGQAAVAIENSMLFKKTEESKNLFLSVLASIKNLIITLDKDGRPLQINRDPMAWGLGITKEKMESAPYQEWFTKRPAGDSDAKTMGDRKGSQTGEGLGRRRSSRLGKPVMEAYYNGLLFESINDCFKNGKDCQVTEYSYTKLKEDGSEEHMTLNYHCMALKDFDGKQTGVILLLEDISGEAKMMATLGKYMSPELAAAALEGGTQLGGQQLPVSVLFVDIRNFTGLSERLEASQVVETLNEYFMLMGGSVLDHGGIVDKYIGDAVMAVFGVPFPAEDDAERVCRCALEQFDLLHAWNARREKEGLEEVRMGIGINTGEVVAGNIGFEKRMEYTVIGDGVNLSSRMEGATKEYKTHILITEFTQVHCDENFYCREVDCIRVVGKKKPVKIYELQGEKAKGALSATRESTNALYAEGLVAYRGRDWELAKAKWQEAVDGGDATAGPMAQRAQFFIGDPIIAPKEGWDGVFDMINK